MLDWLVEVTTIFGCNERTYFLAAQLFDDFCLSSVDLTNEHVHGIGITSLYLASKYEDLRPLHHRVVAEKISHNFFSG